MMNTYQHFATVLTQLLGSDTAVRLTVNGYMPLSVEDIGTSAAGNRLVSGCHYGEENGDLMRDPELVFEISASPIPSTAEPLSFRNDYMGVLQEVYRYEEDGKKTHVNVRLKQELDPSPEHGSPISRSRVFWARPPHVKDSHEPAIHKETSPPAAAVAI